MLINMSSGYNLKLDEQSSYLTTFPCPFVLTRTDQNVIQRVGEHFCTSDPKEVGKPPQTKVYRHHQKRISDPKLVFPKWGRKNQRNS